MSLEIPEFQKRIRIYYEHTDAGGVVYHANYLNFMESTRCDWLADLGHDVATMQERDHLVWVVREANIKYDLPARLFDELIVSCQALQVGKVSLVVQQNIYNEGELLCRGRIKLATLDRTSYKLTAMPETLQTTLKKSVINT
ncbi:MAG: YbgC/FadM family acyl-CoA thioesterase [Pseudomonadota bacterium]